MVTFITTAVRASDLVCFWTVALFQTDAKVVCCLQMGEEVMGKGAAVVVRDRKTGKCRNLEEEARQKQEEDEKMAQHKEKYAKLGKGCVYA
jgi:hypothetical protein